MTNDQIVKSKRTLHRNPTAEEYGVKLDRKAIPVPIDSMDSVDVAHASTSTDHAEGIRNAAKTGSIPEKSAASRAKVRSAEETDRKHPVEIKPQKDLQPEKKSRIPFIGAAVLFAVIFIAWAIRYVSSSTSPKSENETNGLIENINQPGSESEDDSTGGSADGVIKIGGSGPLTGPAAIYGNSVKTAAEMAVEEVNAKGGVQFELQFEDDKRDAEEAVTAYSTLKDGGMQISLETVTSTPGAAVSPLYQEDKIFAITPSASSPAVIYADGDAQTDAYGNIFQMCFSDPNQGSESAAYIAAHPDLGSRIAVIYKNDDFFSKGVFDTFKAQAATEGLEIVYEGTFKGEESDFNEQLGDAQAAGADLLFLPIYYNYASQILTQADKMGYKPTVFGVDAMDGILSMEDFDTSLAEGVYLLTPFVATAEDEMTKTFVENYKARTNGEVPNEFAADAYDCVYAMAQACEAAGITADMSNEEICAAMVEQFTSMAFNGLTGSDMSWNENGEVTKTPKAMIIKYGEYVPAAE